MIMANDIVYAFVKTGESDYLYYFDRNDGTAE